MLAKVCDNPGPHEGMGDGSATLSLHCLGEGERQAVASTLIGQSPGPSRSAPSNSSALCRLLGLSISLGASLPRIQGDIFNWDGVHHEVGAQLRQQVPVSWRF